MKSGKKKGECVPKEVWDQQTIEESVTADIQTEREPPTALIGANSYVM